MTQRTKPGGSRFHLRSFKRLFLGQPISSHQELHHRLSKRIALAVFSSDALSSSAYATDEIFLALALAGSVALTYSVPVGLVVVGVLAVVITSYRQTVRAYPGGGGAYLVARDNLGEKPGLLAASALLIDYVLTVSVSSAAGIAAVIAAFPEIEHFRVLATVTIVALITVTNLRGLKESGTVFAIPTYGFLVILGTLIVIGVVRVLTGNYTPAPPPQFAGEPLTLFIILRAYASGSTALTGIEAIADGVPAFRPPESRNAASTLLVLGILLSCLFFGITFLANAYNVDPHLIEEGQTVPSQIARQVYGEGSLLFYLTQAFTALILFLAANTSFADFPRLASILSRDRYLPAVLRSRGDKLAFSNGIVLLALAAMGVLVHYEADVHRIIPLYVIGVFTSFTLSQSGMILRWRRLRTGNWRRAATVNTIGACTTGLSLIIVSIAKFRLGAWQIILLIPILAAMLRAVRVHYTRVSTALRAGAPLQRVKASKAVVLVSHYPGATTKCVSLARAFSPSELHVVAFQVPEKRLRAVRQRWAELGLKIPIEATGHRREDLLDFVRGLGPSDEQPVTVVMAAPHDQRRMRQILRNRMLLRIRQTLLQEPGVVVASVPYLPETEPALTQLRAPGRLSIIVVVSAVQQATFRALAYARSLNPAELKAVSVALDPADAHVLADDWQKARLNVPLEVVDSPFRSLTRPIVDVVRRLSPSADDAVGVVIPEPVVKGWWWKPLHGQRAVLIKATLMFEQHVFVFDLPYHVTTAAQAGPPRERPGKPQARQETDGLVPPDPGEPTPKE
jgi:amino acid transporter